MTMPARVRFASSRLRAALNWGVLMAGVLSLAVALAGTLFPNEDGPGGMVEAGIAVTVDAL
ncbi:hypothetical protein Ga0609869_000904 [Rhodovulum iodosum]|uniref:ABC transporter permease n=1 Tax=Rhodovulum iodosum TaxID=68291 RepID=A0ABV3XQD7_9RHOB|nr:hypothetical protein [Rhodovulum robiginosum]RSK33010.1 hypothetical protein EJA01_11905 [Rhodovulum robiginosum]